LFDLLGDVDICEATASNCSFKLILLMITKTPAQAANQTLPLINNSIWYFKVLSYLKQYEKDFLYDLARLVTKAQ